MSPKPGIQLHVPNHILFEDDYILVVTKPGGLMVEPDRNGYPNLLQQVKKYLRNKLPKGQEVYAQHIHRLDRPVSGIVLFAKQKAVLKNLSEQFAERRVKKYYQALTEQAPQNRKGTLQHWLRKEKKKAVLFAEEMESTESVVLNYEVNDFGSERFLWDIELQTGKFHQIRAQLSFVGCPIAGDALYNSNLQYEKDAIALHAGKLVFLHPITNQEMILKAENSFKKEGR